MNRLNVLCTMVPAIGRFHVLAPMLHAIRQAGHRLVVVAPAMFGKTVREAGLETMAAGLEISEIRRAAEETLGAKREPPDMLASVMFTQVAPRALLAPVIEPARAWRPDVVLHEEGEYAGPVLAALLRVPNVAVGWPSPARAFEALERVGRNLRSLWTDNDLDPPPMGGIYRHLWFDSCPAALQRPDAGDLGQSYPLRPVALDEPASEPLPPAIAEKSSRPLVHLTLGTVPLYNEAIDIFQRVILGLADEPVRLVVTVGANNDPTRFPQGHAGLWVTRYIPYSQLLPACDLVISHGGAGTTVAALIHGLPHLIIPQGGASQRRNAFACVRAGVGVALEPGQLTTDAVRAHVHALLDGSAHRTAAQGVASAIAAMPPPEQAVRRLEEFVASV